MDILILGGTKFLGRHLVEVAQARGHRVTLFHRGQTGADLYPDVERRIGDRMGDLASLTNGHWDAVIDTSGQHPAAVRDSATLLSGRANHYTFVSTCSVYEDSAVVPMNDSKLHEEAPVTCVGGMKDPDWHYGNHKVGCEVQARASFDGPLLILRPGLIVGAHDFTERFAWWVRRALRGGRLIAPGPPERPVQIIDAHDLAVWTLDLVERGVTGTLDAVGPCETLTFGEILRALPGDFTTTWVDEQFLLDNEIGIWMELPMWIPETDPGFQRVDNSAAVTEGLICRPIKTIVREVAAWCANNPAPEKASTGLSPEKERTLLELWDTKG